MKQPTSDDGWRGEDTQGYVNLIVTIQNDVLRLAVDEKNNYIPDILINMNTT